MQISPTANPDILVIQPQLYGDDRGFFMETYHYERFCTAGIPFRFVQDNHSGSRRGALRGLHYQIQQPQGKLVRVIAGEIFDVAVDIRRSSSTFGKWEGLRLSAENKLQLWIPPGFAHGFYVLTDWAEVTYKATDYYAPKWERTLLWNDPEIGITWPIIPGELPIISSKDDQGKGIGEAELFD